MKAPTFIDRVELHVQAGHGGDGVATFRRERFIPRGGPDGGDGGGGGSVILRADKNVDSLRALFFQPHQRAEHGGPGRKRQCTGKKGKDRIVPVPCGTVVRDAESGEWVGELLSDGDMLRVAKGGRGGLGNMHFKSSTHQAPRECTPGERGETRRLRLELKLISDVGLVGYPNAGKSTLISRLSAARPKIAPYPFTTLHPIIGTIEYPDYRTLRVADIPGLIEGAHAGIGLGYDFLRHIERTRFLVFVIDVATREPPGPSGVYASLLRELEKYNADLLARPRVVVANKMDLPGAEEGWEEFVRQTGEAPLRISALTGQGVDDLRRLLYDWLTAVPREGPGRSEGGDLNDRKEGDSCTG